MQKYDDMGKADDGFAADYEGVYQIMKINKMALKQNSSLSVSD